jgi:5-methylcytosine-specific restriction protein A
MKTFLFVWNPLKWNWKSLERSIEEVEYNGHTAEKWSVISHKKIGPGDRAFLIRLGKNPKGIMGAGFVSTAPFLSKHWSGEDKLVHRVGIDFDVLLNPAVDPLLNLNILNEGDLAQQHWTPQASGIEIKPEVAKLLESVWFIFVTTEKISYDPFRDTITDDNRVFSEGSPNQVVVTRYERNPYARKTCIEHYGLTCISCGFNFEAIYGTLGKDFIHVHHIKQMSSIGKKGAVDPIKDLRPICPNCHAMIHRRKKPYTIEEIKERIKNTR